MRKLVIAAAVSLSLATISVNTHALGLGEIEMYSALNQTLDAEISIVSFAPGELDELDVRLASAEAFASAGLQRSRVLSTLRFGVEQRPDGVPVVKVTSNGPVIEPFLSFLLEVNSPQGGRLIREYTVLLDPPVFANQQSELVVAEPAVIQPIEPSTGVGVSALVDREVDPLAGVELDLASELASQTGVVSFDEDPVVQVVTDDSLINLDSVVVATPDDNAVLLPDNDALGEPLAELFEPVDSGVLGADGEVINLGAELLPQAPEVAQDVGDGVDVSLSQLAESSNAIFTGENNTAFDLNDGAENIVSLDGVTDNVNQNIASVVTPITDQATEIGQSVDLSAIVPGSNEPLPIASTTTIASSTEVAGTVLGTEVDLNGIEFQPEVTLEAVETTMVPVSSLASSNLAGDPISASGEVLGEAIDISGIVPGDNDSLFAAVEPSTFSSESYVVQPNDTLWSIARTNRPSGVSTKQMVVAILEANRDAFVDGDINRLRNGAELQIPGDFGSAGSSEAVQVARTEEAPIATVEDTTDAMAAVDPQEADLPAEGLSIVGVDESASGDGEAVADQMSGDSDLDRNLEAVNKKMMLAQEELTSESLQRDELSSRVVELEESLANMKKLITLRESELGNLQSELTTTSDEVDGMAEEAVATEEAATTEISEAESTETDQTDLLQEEKDRLQANLETMERNINADASLAQERVDAQADADKNLASAEAQAKSVRLATEEDTLKSQLAQLQVEKAQLIESAQNDKLALVQQAEEEKAQLLAEAKAERERIQAKLEDEKNRISEEAEAERLRIAEEAKAEKEKLIAEANSERELLAAESDAMRVRLEALEEEKDRLLKQSEDDKAQLAEATRMADEEQATLQAQAEAEKQRFEEESTKVKDRLAALQAEANANLANTTENATDTASNVMSSTAEAGSDVADAAKNMMGEGAAVAGGVLAAAPLQRTLGERKKVLAAGGGLALLGLLGAWAMRRRKTPVAGDRHRDIPVDIDTSDDLSDAPRAQLDAERGGYDEVEEQRSTMGRAAVAASAAAAATGAAVSLDRTSDHREEAQAAAQTHAPKAANDTPDAAMESDMGHQLVDSSMLDDTITEADVYLRYGLHGQAEDLLKTAIERAPENEEYHLKLLENYHDQQNSEGFKEAAANYQERFGATEHWERIAEMGRTMDSGDSFFSRAGAMDAAAGGAAAAGVAAAAVTSLGNDDDAVDATNLDETLDASAEFDVDDLAATGNFDQLADEFSIDDLDDISLDEVDLAALDDDGTLNLEEVAGNQMSGVDLGTLDLTNPDGDSTLDNLTLDDADLNSLGDVTSNVRSGLESDIDLSDNYTADSNEMETMLDLAKAYIDMGDTDSAANALRDIVNNGNEAQKKEASDLLNNLN